MKSLVSSFALAASALLPASAIAPTSRRLEFEKAALRDELVSLRKAIGGNESLIFQGKAPKIFQHALKELIGT